MVTDKVSEVTEGKEQESWANSEKLENENDSVFCPKCSELVPPSHSCHRDANGTLSVWE